jgi:cyclohexa-1,5-dienecarbonyl-CoA hydratase
VSVRLEVEGRVATVTLDRPPLNVLDLDEIAELGAAFDRLAEEPELQLAILRSGVGKAFSAGVAVEIHTPEKIPEMLESFHGALRKLHRLDAVTVAAVAAPCLGGGMELAAVCDLVVAADGATFGQPEIHVGCYPPVAAALYPSLLGHARTIELIVTGRTLDAAEAEKIGFVTRRVPAGGLDGAIAELTEEVTGKSAAVVRLAKKATRAARGDAFESALAEAERIYLEELIRTADVEEGARAFLEKRPAVWRHR